MKLHFIWCRIKKKRKRGKSLNGYGLEHPHDWPGQEAHNWADWRALYMIVVSLCVGYLPHSKMVNAPRHEGWHTNQKSQTVTSNLILFKIELPTQ